MTTSSLRRTQSPAPRRTALALLALPLLGLAAACASAPVRPTEAVVWPLPPDKPRIKYVRSFSNTADFETSTMGKIGRGLLGQTGGVGLKNPVYLALSPDETRLYVTCSSRAFVLEFDLARNKVRQVANPEGGTPRVPWGLALDATGNLYVGDQFPAEPGVWVYAPNGTLVRRIGQGKLVRPTGLAIDRQRQLLYVAEGGKIDNMRHQVEVFALDGRHLRTIGGRGDKPGLFNFPSYLAVSPEGNLYVTDTANARFQFFDPDGALLGVFGQSGLGPGSFNRLKGLAFDTFGNIHAADGQASIVQIFNARLQPLMAYGGPLGRPEFMGIPNGLVIDSKNNIYVADYAMDHVNQYVLFNTEASEVNGESAPASAPASSPAALQRP